VSEIKVIVTEWYFSYHTENMTITQGVWVIKKKKNELEMKIFSDRGYLKWEENIKLISLHHFRYKIGTKKGN
jgi:hypothetical protein